MKKLANGTSLDLFIIENVDSNMGRSSHNLLRLHQCSDLSTLQTALHLSRVTLCDGGDYGDAYLIFICVFLYF